MAASPQQGSAPASEVVTLATLLHLQRRARAAADEAELNFILANESFNLAPYRQAVVWLRRGGVVALSGVVSPEANAPYVQWLERIFRHFAAQQDGADQAVLLQAENLPPEGVAQWSEWLPAQALLLPLPAVGRSFEGGFLLLARDSAWSAGETALLEEWASAWGHVRALVEQGKPLQRAWRRLLGQPAPMPSAASPALGWLARVRQVLRLRKVQVGLLMLVVLVLPVRLTVLAPADLIPLDPHIIRAPLDGVVERVLVAPNQVVAAGDPLLEFDRVAVFNRLQIALGALSTVVAEYRQRAQQSLLDSSSTAELATLQGQIREKEIEAAFLRDLLDRGVVQAPASGMVLMGDPVEWSGRPVVTGERILVVADEQAMEVEAWLSPGDAIPLPPGARLRLYLNADPLTAVEAVLRYVAHEAVERPDGQYAYRVRATLVEPVRAQVRIGLKGTARIDGERVSVAYWVMRRPLAGLRAWLGV